jgi:hypothetical protein
VVVEGAQATETKVMEGEVAEEDWFPPPQLVKAVRNREPMAAKR